MSAFCVVLCCVCRVCCVGLTSLGTALSKSVGKEEAVRRRTLRREYFWRVEVLRQRIAFWHTLWCTFVACKREGKPVWMDFGFHSKTLPLEREMLAEYKRVSGGRGGAACHVCAMCVCHVCVP